MATPTASVRSIIQVTALAALSACKPTGPGGLRYSGSELMGVNVAALSAVPGVSDTPTAGAKARELNAYPGELDQPAGGLGLDGGFQALRAGDRICVSTDYGRAGDNPGNGNANEAAAKCGMLEACDQREGWHRDLPARPGDLCMRADCLSKSNQAGLDMPGEVDEGQPVESGVVRVQTVCGVNGRSTAFNVSEYFRGLGAFAFDAGTRVTPQAGIQPGTAGGNVVNPMVPGAGGFGLTYATGSAVPGVGAAMVNALAQGLLQGDEQYAATRGLAGNTSVTLADETLYNGDVFMTEYRTNSLALNAGGDDAVARVGVNRGASGRTVIMLFEETGSDVSMPTSSPIGPGGDPGVVSTDGGGVVTPIAQNGPVVSGPPDGGQIVDAGSGGVGPGGLALRSGAEAGTVRPLPGAPSAQQLGLVRTRRGNTFSLIQSESGYSWLGPKGTVKVLIGGR